jgi:hypothetical protein
LISALVRFKFCALATLAPNALTPSAASQIIGFVMAIPLL